MNDSRHIAAGLPIASEGYADQPYIVRTDDGAWLCVITTGTGAEGDAGQHVISLRSTDQGRSWEPAVDVEPATGPEASYAVLFKTPFGRVYCFYNHNTDNVREVKREDGKTYRRVDSLGHYVFKYSDDHGRTWSARRYEVPVREFACDRANVYGGKLRFFWNVGRPILTGNAMLLPHHKVGAMGEGFFAQSEGVFLRSENVLTERDPAQMRFETLPVGDVGLRTPPGGGRVAEEQSVAELSDGSLFCVYRSVDGWPVHAYSRDGGRTWTPPAYLTYTPGGRRIKHPRAANFVWRCRNGQFLYWFHNHGIEGSPYDGRNPVWLCAGREVGEVGARVIQWSQPEIVLYDDDPIVRMSYPDLIEEDGRFFVTETQKHLARVHEIDPALLAGLFGQWDRAEITRQGLVPDVAALPALRARDGSSRSHGTLNLRQGFTIECRFRLDALVAGIVLCDNRLPSGRGWWLQTTNRGTVEIILNDGAQECRWDTDTGLLEAGRWHHLAAIVDGGPNVILFVVDGLLNDGGDFRPYGWGRFSPTLNTPRGKETLTVGAVVETLRLYARPLRISEVVANYREPSVRKERS